MLLPEQISKVIVICLVKNIVRPIESNAFMPEEEQKFIGNKHYEQFFVYCVFRV